MQMNKTIIKNVKEGDIVILSVLDVDSGQLENWCGQVVRKDHGQPVGQG